jgi:hypothetical protein
MSKPKVITIALVAYASLAVGARADMVTDWNGIAVGALPPLAQGLPHARVMGYMHAAIFDAVNAVERKYTPFAVDVKAPKASAEAAAATAAHGMLLRFYPLEKAALDARLQASLATITDDSEAKSEGIELGRIVAEQVFERSRSDRYDVPALPFVPGTDPWSWQFTAPGMVARGVTWGGSKPFFLNSPDQFAFAGPHKVTSTDYAKDIEEVRKLGGEKSTERTPHQTAVAIFWTVSATIVMNHVAVTDAKDRKLNLIDNARLLALLNMAAADSLIATWHQKFTTNFLRPVTAIRNASRLDNPAIQEDPDWTPLLVTPAHPDYPSGHCAYEGAATRVLQLFFGTDQTKASYTYPPNAVTLRWTSYSQMANEVGDARVWGGIHTRTADEHADMVGKKIGEYSFTNFLRPVGEGAN